MKNDNRNDRRTSGPAKGTEKTKATGKANAAGKTKVTAGKENRVPVGQGREKTAVKKRSGLCPVADKCGGCSWINKPYVEQLKNKEKQLKELLAPFCKVEGVIPMEHPEHYRNKVHAVFGENRYHDAISGIYEQKSHRIVPVDSCLIEDDEADAEKSVNAYNALKDWGAQIIDGSTTSGACIAVTDKTKEDNMFQITPSGSAVECVQYDNNFRVCFSNPNQGLASAQYIGENGLAEKIAVIYDSSDVYSSGIYEKFVKEAENQPFEVVAAEAFTADNKTDFSVQLQKAKDAGADMVFLPIYYQESALILTQAAAMGYAPKWFSCDGMDGILGGVDNFDVSLTEGVMLLTPFAADATDDLTQSFVTKYKEKYGETPNQFAADSYDAIYVIKAAIEKSGVTPDMSVSDICDGMKAAMTEITVDGLTGSGMTWTADGEANKAPKAVVIENGAYKAM